MKIIIIEGPDCSGKTTAIDQLSKKLKNCLIIKNGYRPTSNSDNTIIQIYHEMQEFLFMMSSLDRNSAIKYIILDRFYPSEVVYSILRNHDRLIFDTGIEEIEKFCKSENYKLILIDTPIEILEQRYDNRGDDFIKKQQLKLLYKRYQIFYNKTGLDKIKIDTREYDWINKIVNYINK